jgi:hypothetical protein
MASASRIGHLLRRPVLVQPPLDRAKSYHAPATEHRTLRPIQPHQRWVRSALQAHTMRWQDGIRAAHRRSGIDRYSRVVRCDHFRRLLKIHRSPVFRVRAGPCPKSGSHQPGTERPAISIVSVARDKGSQQLGPRQSSCPRVGKIVRGLYPGRRLRVRALGAIAARICAILLL